MTTLQFFADSLYRLSPYFYYGLHYFWVRKRLPNFKRPEDLSEYLLGEMLKPEFKRFADYADKVKVRRYVERKGLGELLPKLYGVWNQADEIDIEALPKKFALKTNHGCGGHVLCKDKSRLRLDKIRKEMSRLLSHPFSIREPHYPYIAPKIYAEELIEYIDCKSLIDYKFMCIKGDVKCILVCSDRSVDFHKVNLCTLDTEWNVLPWQSSRYSSDHLPLRPKHLKEMIYYAKILSADFDFVRVDLYDTGEKVYFGELTFTPNCSFLTYWTRPALMRMAEGLMMRRDYPQT